MGEDHVRRLEDDLKYYRGVFDSYSKRPIEQVGSRTPEQQRAAYGEIVKQLEEALAIAKRNADHAQRP